MIILTIRTDKPEAEIGLFEDDQKLAYKTWTAHRQLGLTIHSELAELLKTADVEWEDLQGVVAFAGPGSFTGLRIGLTVANALAYGYSVAVTGAQGENWIAEGIAHLRRGEDAKMVMPEYGSEAHITTPRT